MWTWRGGSFLLVSVCSLSSHGCMVRCVTEPPFVHLFCPLCFPDLLTSPPPQVPDHAHVDAHAHPRLVVTTTPRPPTLSGRKHAANKPSTTSVRQPPIPPSPLAFADRTTGQAVPPERGNGRPDTLGCPPPRAGQPRHHEARQGTQSSGGSPHGTGKREGGGERAEGKGSPLQPPVPRFGTPSSACRYPPKCVPRWSVLTEPWHIHHPPPLSPPPRREARGGLAFAGAKPPTASHWAPDPCRPWVVPLPVHFWSASR